MAEKPESISGCWFGKRYFTKNSWRRIAKTAKRALRRKRRRMEKEHIDPPTRLTKGWAD